MEGQVKSIQNQINMQLIKIKTLEEKLQQALQVKEKFEIQLHQLLEGEDSKQEKEISAEKQRIPKENKESGMPAQKPILKKDKKGEDNTEKEVQKIVAKKSDGPQTKDALEHMFSTNSSMQEQSDDEGDGGKWYVIFNGPHTGIYRHWHIVSSLVSGTSCIHKSYKNELQAKKTLKNAAVNVLNSKASTSKQQALKRLPPKIPDAELIQASRNPTEENLRYYIRTITNFGDIQASQGFYPISSFRPLVAMTEKAHEITVFSYWNHGCVGQIYPNSDLNNLKEFPMFVQQAVQEFKTYIAKDKGVFIQSKGSYPEFNGAGIMMCSTYQVLILEISNGRMTKRKESQKIQFTPESQAEGIMEAYAALTKPNYRVRAIGKNVIVISHGKEKENDLAHKRKFLRPIRTLEGVFHNLNDNTSRIICEQLKEKEDNHKCRWCENQKDNDDMSVIIEDASDEEET